MAARAGDRTRRRPALVPEELLAQRDLLRGDRIVVRDLRGVLLESERQLELEVRRQRPAGDQQNDDGEDEPDQPCHACPRFRASLTETFRRGKDRLTRRAYPADERDAGGGQDGREQAAGAERPGEITRPAGRDRPDDGTEKADAVAPAERGAEVLG